MKGIVKRVLFITVLLCLAVIWVAGGEGDPQNPPEQSSSVRKLYWLPTGNPVDTSTHINSNPADNRETTYTMRLEFSFGTKTDPDIPPGGIEIRIPRYIFKDRGGNPIINFNTLIPSSSNPNHGQTYHYTEYDDHIVITNATTTSPAGSLQADFSFSFMPWQVKHETLTEGLTATFTVKRPNQKPDPDNEPSSPPLSIKFENHATHIKPEKTGKASNPENWPPVLRDGLNINHDDYIYVQWSVKHYADQSNTEPFTLDVEDIPDPAGELIGWRSGNNVDPGTTVRGNLTDYHNENNKDVGTFRKSRVSFPKASNPLGASGYYRFQDVLYFRYERENLTFVTLANGDRVAKLKNTFISTLNGVDDRVIEEKSTAFFDYTEKVYDPEPGDKIFQKTGGGTHLGYVNKLRKEAELPEADRSFIDLSYGRTIFQLNENTSAPELVYDVSTHQMYPSDVKWTTVITDDTFSIKANNEERPLVPGEYQITGVTLNALWDHLLKKDVAAGYVIDYKPRNDDTYVQPRLEIKQNGVWGLFGTFSANPNSTSRLDNQFTFEETNSTINITYADKIPLPPGVEGVRLTHISHSAKVYFSVQLHLALKPTDDLMAFIGPANDVAVINNRMDYEVKDAEGDPVVSGFSTASFNLQGYRGTSVLSKTMNPPVQDRILPRFTLDVRITANESLAFTGRYDEEYEEIKAMGVQAEHRQAVFYDLLPPGTHVLPGSISLSDSKLTNPPNISQIPFITATYDNWRGSGRTLLVVTATVRLGEENYYYNLSSNSINSGMTLRYTLVYPFGEMPNWGTTLRNYAAYQLKAQGDTMWNGRADDGGALPVNIKPLMSDLDNNGPNPGKKTFCISVPGRASLPSPSTKAASKNRSKQ